MALLLVLNVLTVTSVAVFEAVRGAVTVAAGLLSSVYDVADLPLGWRESLADRDRMQAKLAQAEADLVVERRALGASRARVETLENEERRLASALAQSEADLATERRAVQSGRVRIGELEGEQRRLRSTLSQTEASLAAERRALEANRARVVALEGEERRLASALAQSEADLALEQRAVQSERARIDEIEGELDTARRQATQADEALQTERRVMSHARADAGEVIDRIERRTMRVAGANIAGEPASLIPIAGTAAVFGLLAYELHEACETLADLAALKNRLASANGGETDPASDRDTCLQNVGDVLEEMFGKDAVRCYEARARTNTTDPPECADFPLDLPSIPDPEIGRPTETPMPDIPPIPAFE